MISFYRNDQVAKELQNRFHWLGQCLDAVESVTPEKELVRVTDGIGVKLVEYDTTSPSACRFETHRDHVDVQVGMKGSELIHLVRRRNLDSATKWDEKEDVIFYDDPERELESVVLEPERVLVLFPEDAHRCASRLGNCDPELSKLVFKVHRKVWKPGAELKNQSL